MHRILLFILLSTTLFAKDNIAVLELEQKGLTKQEAEILTDRLISNLISIDKYQVVERTNMDKILKEQKFQSSGCTDSECAVEIGQLLNTDFIVIGSVSKFGSMYSLDSRLIDVAQGKGLISAEYSKIGEIEILMSEGITSIAKQLCGMQTTNQSSITDSVGELIDSRIGLINNNQDKMVEKASTSFLPKFLNKHLIISPPHFGKRNSYSYHTISISFNISERVSHHKTMHSNNVADIETYLVRKTISYIYKRNRYGIEFGLGSASLYRHYRPETGDTSGEQKYDLQYYKMGLQYYIINGTNLSFFATANIYSNDIIFDHADGGTISESGNGNSYYYTLGVKIYDWLTIEIGQEFMYDSNVSTWDDRHVPPEFEDDNMEYSLFDIHGTLSIPFRFKE